MCLQLSTVKSLVTGVYRQETPMPISDNSSSLFIRRGSLEVGLSHGSMCIWMLARCVSQSILYLRLCFPEDTCDYPEVIPRERPARRQSLEPPRCIRKVVKKESNESLRSAAGFTQVPLSHRMPLMFLCRRRNSTLQNHRLPPVAAYDIRLLRKWNTFTSTASVHGNDKPST